MARRAECVFTVDTTNTDPVEWPEDSAVHRNRFGKTFTGELAGSSVVEATMFGMMTGDPAAYVAIERFEGAVGDRKGSFVLLHAGTISGGAQSTTLTILAGSGTGDLVGIAGHADLLPDHHLVLHYDISDAL
jgi:Protein of unknown function (DUF3224)